MLFRWPAPWFLPLVLGLFLHANPGVAEGKTWAVSLGNISLGQLSFEQGGGSISLKTNVNNTPLGVFNGTFEATSKIAADGDILFASHSRTSSSARDISFAMRAGRITTLAIMPESERTALSDPAKVPAGVLDPSMAFARLVAPGTCPADFSLFDGRRVVQVSLTENLLAGGVQTCKFSYNVTQGPGHLSPFRFKSLRLEATYAPIRDGQVLDRLVLRVGVFALKLRRL